MADEALGKPRDPQFPDYVYAARPLIEVFRDRDGRKRIGNLFLGEWMKVLDERVSPKRLMRVKYRGGEGYVAPTDVSRDRFLEIFFIDVSQGDAILIQTPDDRRILIDGGDTEDAWSFIRNKYRLDKPDNYIDLDAVVATHSDSDHAGGLVHILTDRKIAVKRFYHIGLFRRTDSAGDPGPHTGGRVSGLEDRPEKGVAPALTPLMRKLLDAVDQAEQNLPVVVGRMAGSGRRVDTPAGGFVCRRLDAADRYLPPYDDPAKLLTIEVLWPKAEVRDGRPTYPWYGTAGRTVNGNSVTLCARHGDRRFLLSGDLNADAMEHLLKSCPEAALAAHVYKAAHHGSQDFSVPFLKAVKPDVAVISSGDDGNDIHGHPRAVLVGTITRYSRCERPAVFITELAACYQRLSREEQARFDAGKTQLYERSIQGIIHLRSNGQELCVGSVHGTRARYKWDVWPQARIRPDD
jgi:beta-lactamase superfamily II metal-dependent hydrolase